MRLNRPFGRALARACAAAALFSLATAAQEKGAIEGVVTNSVTKAGIPDVSVLLFAGTGEEPIGRTTTADSGAFRFADLGSGAYRIELSRDGFEEPDDESSRRTVRVAGGPEAVRARFELIPLATLHGRVLDASGNPVAGAMVDWLTEYHQERIRTKTDGEGRFEVSEIIPGSYLLRARRPRIFIESATADAGANDPCRNLPRDAVWAPRYYPGALMPGQSTAISFVGGEDLSDYTITLPCPTTFAISGVVADEFGDAAPRAEVTLASAYPGGLQPDAKATSGTKGEFRFPAVAPGDWWITATIPRPGGELIAYRRITVAREDYSVGEVRVQAPFRFEMAVNGLEKLPPSPGPGWRGRFVPLDGPLVATVFADQLRDGKIASSLAYPGRYLLANPDPKGYYLDAIFIGDAEIRGREVTLSPSMPALRLLYKSDGGRVQGRIDPPQPAAVVVAPAGAGTPARLRWTQSDGDGNFQLSNLRPGNYYVLAFDRIDAGALSDAAAPDRLSVFCRDAVTVTVENNQTAQVALRGVARYRYPLE